MRRGEGERSVGDPTAQGGTLPRTPYENKSGVWGGEKKRVELSIIVLSMEYDDNIYCSSCQMDLIFWCWKCSPGRRSNDDDKYVYFP
jgi:hypothetical protein